MAESKVQGKLAKKAGETGKGVKVRESLVEWPELRGDRGLGHDDHHPRPRYMSLQL